MPPSGERSKAVMVMVIVRLLPKSPAAGPASCQGKLTVIGDDPVPVYPHRGAQASGLAHARVASLLRDLLEALDQPLAFEAGQPLDPEQAIELIDLVLVADRAQASGFLGVRMAIDVVIADPDARMAPDLVMDPRHRDAAFLMRDDLGRCPGDLRIDIGAR